MADNTPQNGTASVATDDIGGAHFQRVKLIHGADGTNDGDVSTANGLPALLTANAGPLWPGYGPPSDTGQRSALIDDDGSLQVRSAVLTDEGTFRVNFANTSLFVSIGSVTVSGTTVTGSGFMTADVHFGDYFKIAADADTFCQQIASIDSDTQITLKAAYTGTTSGTGNRSLLHPFTGTGGSQSVASGALTLTGGTTASAITGVKRYTDYGPLVFRARTTVSQRIANQEIHIGLEEDAATTRWFARFLLDGTTNTTVKCETGRNPTGAPSASETQSTTVTLPNGATTATARDYRVELLTESVRFFVDGVLLAEHVLVIPHQHDEMTSHVEIRNGGTAPASSTTVTVDYITGKNHNKVEIGVMSDAEKIVASQPPVAEFFYSQAGVIAINTILMTVDCSQIRSLSIQVASMGTTGVITPEWSNDPAFAQLVAGNVISLVAGSGAQATITAAGIYGVPTPARYLRLRLSTATTAGTTTLRVAGFQHPSPFVYNTRVSGIDSTVTVAAAAGTAAIGDVGVQYRANATGGASLVSVLSPATPAAATVKASAGRLIGWQLQNSSAALRSVKFFNATAPTLGTTSAIFEVDIPAGGRSEINLSGGIGAFSTACTYSVTSAKGLTDNTATGLVANDVSGCIFFA